MVDLLTFAPALRISVAIASLERSFFFMKSMSSIWNGLCGKVRLRVVLEVVVLSVINFGILLSYVRQQGISSFKFISACFKRRN